MIKAKDSKIHQEPELGDIKLGKVTTSDDTDDGHVRSYAILEGK
jgi:hypothetical protein